MNEKTLKLLEEMGKELGVATEYLWEVLVRQQIIDAWLTLLYSPFLLLGVYGCYKAIRWATKKEDAYEDPYLMITLSSGIIGIIILAITIGSLFKVPYLLLNPEYYALKEILRGI